MLLPFFSAANFSSFGAQAQLMPPAAWQGLSHLGKSFTEGHGREPSGLLTPRQALPRVAPQLSLSFQVAVPHCGFLLLFKLPLTQMSPSCMSALAAPNHGGCNTSRISHSPPLSFSQGRRLFIALLFPSAPLKGSPSNPIFSRTAAHRSNSLKGCI